jgi:formylglycine-generating enzyme required for sulfatase activity
MSAPRLRQPYAHHTVGVRRHHPAGARTTRSYPWGWAAPSCADAAFSGEDCEEGYAEIARFPPSPEGLYDLAGNAAELVAIDPTDYVDGYPPPEGHLVPKTDCEKNGEDNYKEQCPDFVFRGGSRKSPGYQLRGAHRRVKGPGPVGFRCVTDP